MSATNLALYRALTQLGIPESVAEDAATGMLPDLSALATKADVAELRLATKADLAELRGELRGEQKVIRAILAMNTALLLGVLWMLLR